MYLKSPVFATALVTLAQTMVNCAGNGCNTREVHMLKKECFHQIPLEKKKSLSQEWMHNKYRAHLFRKTPVAVSVKFTLGKPLSNEILIFVWRN